MTTRKTAPIGMLPDFHAKMASRMRVGQREYGDRSFELSPLRLIDEIQQELIDVANWSFVLWQRLEQMRVAISNARLQEQERCWTEPGVED